MLIFDRGKVSARVSDRADSGGSRTGRSPAFIDLNDIIARRYDALGPEKVGKEYFGPTDHTPTTGKGARVNAACVVEGIRGLKDARVAGLLKAEAPQAPAAAAAPAASEHK